MTRLSSLTGKKSRFTLRRGTSRESCVRRSGRTILDLLLLAFVTIGALGGLYFQFWKPAAAAPDAAPKSVDPRDGGADIQIKSSTTQPIPATKITKDKSGPKETTKVVSKSRSSSERIQKSKSQEATSGMEKIHVIYKKIREGNLDGGNQEKYIIFGAYEEGTETPVSVEKWAKLMSEKADDNMALDITKVITDVPYRGVYFETKGVHSGNADSKHFQFCLVDGERLANFAEPLASSKAFDEHFKFCDDGHTCQFPNLGNDALLIVPEKPDNTLDDTTFSHLLAFLRGAPQEQIKATWKKVAFIYYDMIKNRAFTEPLWLSTAGGGIPWLHFRLDDRPKYFNYKPFAESE